MSARTVGTRLLLFPSLGFFQALQARMNEHEARYRAIGIMDLYLGVRILPEGVFRKTALYALLFDGYSCEKVEELASASERDLDVVIEGPYGAWKGMFQNIQANGKADTRHTLNHLTMLDDPLRTVGSDQSRVDKVYRYNFSLQSFLNEAAGLESQFR